MIDIPSVNYVETDRRKDGRGDVGLKCHLALQHASRLPSFFLPSPPSAFAPVDSAAGTGSVGETTTTTDGKQSLMFVLTVLLVSGGDH